MSKPTTKKSSSRTDNLRVQREQHAAAIEASRAKPTKKAPAKKPKRKRDGEG